MLTRQNVWTLTAGDTWDPVLLAYAEAVGVMQNRDPDNSTSWSYLAAVHDMIDPPINDRFLATCQHNSWFFLPWHRSYLLHFESVVRATMADLPTVPADVRDNWALPYWGYERGGVDAAAIPPAFRTTVLPDGRPNPLFRPGRNPAMAQGGYFRDEAVSTLNAMVEIEFSEPITMNQPSGFGGSVTQWHHLNGPGWPGALEVAPHNSVHGGVGGDMGSFATAPLDPLFWFHHCNIDRLWTVWLTLGNGRANPKEQAWLQPHQTFHFNTDDGGETTTTPEQSQQTEDLGYMYDDVTPQPDPMRRRRSTPATPRQRRGSAPPELVGTNEQPVDLAGAAVEARFPLDTPVDVDTQRRRRSDPAAGPTRVYLGVDDIEGTTNPSLSYAIYLNIPDDDPDTRDDYFVGTLSFFGIEAATDLDRDHTGAPGLRYVFEVTDVVDALQAEGRWDPAQVAVSFQPLLPLMPDGTAPLPQDPVPAVRVGRVSLFYQ